MSEIEAASGQVRHYSSMPAKITRPDFAAITDRTRLFDLLDGCLENPVTWVSGPPGSGKTALVSSYIDSRSIPSTWYQLDQGEADPATLFFYLDHAARFYSRDRETCLPGFTVDALPGLLTFARLFFESFFRHLPEGSILVFDDYQEVPENCDFHEIIRTGLKQIPYNLRVLVISRTGPPPSLMRLRADGRMSFLGWEDLRLTLQETRNLIIKKSKNRISDNVIEKLHRITDGWAAGLVLLTEDKSGMELCRDAANPDVIPHEQIFDYFAGEILERIDNEARDFLCKTSMLPWITVTTAYRLTESPRSEEFLIRLCNSNTFIEKRLADTVYYQYHPLFRRFLLNRLISELREPELRKLRQKAAGILEAEGAIEEALGLFQDAGDWQEASRILMQNAPLLISRGRLQTLEHRLTALPEKEIEKNPWFIFWLGMCRISRQPEQARELLKQAYQNFKENRDHAGLMLAWSGVVDTHLHIFNTFAPLDKWLSEIDLVIEGASPFPSPGVESKTISSMILAMVLRQPDHPEISPLMQRCRQLAENCGTIPIKIQAFLPLGFCRVMLGNFREASELIEKFGRYVDNPEIPPLFKIMHNDLVAFLCWKTAEFDRCFRAFEEGLAVLNEIEIPGWRIFLRGHAAAAALSLGNTEYAEHILHQAAADIDMARAWAKCYYHVMCGWNAMIRNDPAAAVYHTDTAVKLAFESGEKHGIAVAYLGKAIAMQMSGQTRDALNLLASGRSLGSVKQNMFMEFQYCLAEAGLFLKKGMAKKCAGLLSQGLNLGRKQGYFNTYFWQPRIASGLCAAALEMGIETEYVQRLITFRNLVPEKRLFHVPEWPWPIKIFALGSFKVLVNEQQLHFTHKAQQRPLDLLKALLAAGDPAGVEKGRVCDMIWPDSEGDAAQSALSTTLHRLRRLLKNDKAVKLEKGMVFLNERLCWADTWYLQSIFKHIHALFQSGRDFEEIESRVLFLMQKALDLHSAGFLAEDTQEKPWADPFRERMRTRLTEMCLRTGKALENNKKWDEALFLYRQAREIDPLKEVLYQRLLSAYAHLGYKAEAVREYRRCRRTLSEHLNCEPSARTRAIYESL